MKAAEEHRPRAPAVEQSLGERDMSGAEVVREAPAQPVEQRQAEPAADGVAGRVADHRADHRGSTDADRVDRQLMPRRQQCGADEDDLTRQRDAQALHPDNHADHDVHSERGDRLQQGIHRHGLRMPDLFAACCR